MTLSPSVTFVDCISRSRVFKEMVFEFSATSSLELC